MDSGDDPLGSWSHDPHFLAVEVQRGNMFLIYSPDGINVCGSRTTEFGAQGLCIVCVKSV